MWNLLMLKIMDTLQVFMDKPCTNYKLFETNLSKNA